MKQPSNTLMSEAEFKKLTPSEQAVYTGLHGQKYLPQDKKSGWQRVRLPLLLAALFSFLGISIHYIFKHFKGKLVRKEPMHPNEIIEKMRLEHESNRNPRTLVLELRKAGHVFISFPGDGTSLIYASDYRMLTNFPKNMPTYIRTGSKEGRYTAEEWNALTVEERKSKLTELLGTGKLYTSIGSYHDLEAFEQALDEVGDAPDTTDQTVYSMKQALANMRNRYTASTLPSVTGSSTVYFKANTQSYTTFVTFLTPKLPLFNTGIYWSSPFTHQPRILLLQIPFRGRGVLSFFWDPNPDSNYASQKLYADWYYADENGDMHVKSMLAASINPISGAWAGNQPRLMTIGSVSQITDSLRIAIDRRVTGSSDPSNPATGVLYLNLYKASGWSYTSPREECPLVVGMEQEQLASARSRQYLPNIISFMGTLGQWAPGSGYTVPSTNQTFNAIVSYLENIGVIGELPGNTLSGDQNMAHDDLHHVRMYTERIQAFPNLYETLVFIKDVLPGDADLPENQIIHYRYTHQNPADTTSTQIVTFHEQLPGSPV